MVIWNWGTANVNLGAADTRSCEVCGSTRTFSVVLQYSYFALYWIFGVVTGRKYLLTCDVCNNGWELDKEKVSSTLTSDPLSFMQRFGLGSLVGGLALLVALAG